MSKSCVMILFFCKIIFAFESSAKASGECSLAGLVQLCDSLPQASSAFVNLPNGQRLANPNSSSSSVEPLTSYQKGSARIRINKRFAFVKEQMKKEILAGGDQGLGMAERRAWIERIDRLSLNIENCEGNDTGGSYDTFRHRLSVCLRSGLSSDGQLTWLLAHEAAHSIDGCASQKPFCKRNHLLSAPSNGSASEDLKRALVDMNASHYFVPKTDEYLSQPEELKALMDLWRSSGLIDMIDNGLEASRFPLSPVLSCLRREGLIAPGAEVVKAQDCAKSVVSETPSDIWGARIAGQYLKLHPPSSPIEKLATLSNQSIELMCSQRTGPKPKPALDSPIWEKSKASTFRYIGDRYRDEATLLSDSNIQKALGCAAPPSPRGQCMNLFEPSMQSFGAGASMGTVAPTLRSNSKGTAQ